MGEESAAVSMVNYFSSGTSAQLRGRNVFVQFSNHSHLKTDQSHSNAVIHSETLIIYYISQYFFPENEIERCSSGSSPGGAGSCRTDGDPRRTEHGAARHRRAHGLPRHSRRPVSGQLTLIPFIRSFIQITVIRFIRADLFQSRSGSEDRHFHQEQYVLPRSLSLFLSFSLSLFPSSSECI